MYSNNKSQKKSGLYKALAKSPEVVREYVKQYTQGQADLPDELIELFGQAQGDEKKVEQLCNNLKKSKEGAQLIKIAEQVYQAAQKEIDAEVNSATNSLFRDGGKFQYLRKLAGGETVPETDETKNKSVAKRRDLNSPSGYRIVRGSDPNGNPVDVATPQSYGFIRDTASFGPVKYVVSYVYPEYNRSDGRTVVPAFDESRGQMIYEDTFGKRDTTYFNYPDYYMPQFNPEGRVPGGTAPDQEAAKKRYYQFLEYVDPKYYPDVQKAKAEKKAEGGLIKNLKWK